MSRNIIILGLLFFSQTLFSQEKIYIHKSDQVSLGALISKTDSIYFSSDGAKIIFSIAHLLNQYQVSEIDSVSFGANSNTVLINYDGTKASVINPLAFEGVSVTVNGADVIVNSTTDTEFNCSLKGISTDGMFKLYSKSRTTILLNGLNLTNANGPAVNIQTSKKSTINVVSGTTNTLSDGSSYLASSEDQKATLFSEGQLEFSGTGNLTVRSLAAHAIASDDYVSILDGNITVSGAVIDGIHAKDHFKMSGGNLTIASSADGIESEDGYVLISGGNITTVNPSVDAKGISCDSTFNMLAGTIKITMGGNQSKGIKAVRKMIFSGGDVTINSSGGVVLIPSGSGNDPSYSSGIKGDGDIEISGCTMTITGTGSAFKGITTNGNISMTSGTLNITNSGTGTTYRNSLGATDAYSAAAIIADGNISIIGGSVTTTSSGAGGKGLSANGNLIVGDSLNNPTLNITATGAKFLVSGKDYCHPKTFVFNNQVIINSGTIAISSSDDGIHAEKSFILNGGSVNISNAYEGIESLSINIKGGTLNVSATNDGLNATAGSVSGGTEGNDGSSLNISGGSLFISASGGDAIDSNGNITVTGGVTVANGPMSGVEEACDFNGSFNMSGGVFVGAGSNSNMTKAMSATSTQVNLLIKSSGVIASSSLLHIQNASGTNILTFKPKNGGYYFLFSSNLLTKGMSCSIYTGGSYTGGTSENGIYSGGSYSGGTIRKTLNLSSSSTVNTVTF